MALKEHENNIITKEENDPITLYLKNIIQRYFQIENDISQENKEAIIIQAYTRLKEYLNAFTNQYIICVNERSGAIDLAIRDFGGEQAFDKGSAFNKDFCDVTTETKTLWDGTNEEYNNFGEEQADRMVAGDDDRLYDARIPLAHVHTIDDINGLRDFLEGYHLINGGFHLHNNLKFLEMIIYAGSRTSIDLILLEDLVAKVEKSVDKFTETNIYINTTAQHYINQLQEIFVPIYNKLKEVDDNLNSWIVEWFDQSKLYTDLKENSLRNYIVEFAKQYLSVTEYNLLKETLEKSVRVIEDRSFRVGDLMFGDIILDSVNTHSTKMTYHTLEFDAKEGYTKVALSTQRSQDIDTNVLEKIYDNNVLNTVQKFFLEYEKDGVTYSDQLPHIYQVNDSRHDFILVYANVDENNKVNAYFKRLSYLPVYLYHPIVINSFVEDKSGKNSVTAYLVLDKDDIEDKSNGNVQDNTTKKLHDSVSGTFDNLSFAADAYLNTGDTYAKHSRLHWSADHIFDYSYKVLKRENNGPWKDLMYSSAYSSTELTALQTVYNDGNVCSFYTDGTITYRTTPAQKAAIWQIVDGYLVSVVNNANLDALLTKDTYSVYRHRATLTANADDNDVIVIVISAVNYGGTIHTLSLVCDKGGEGHTLTGLSGCSLIYNYSSLNQQTLATFSHGGNTSNWNVDTKINFDIRKDHKNVIIYSSDFYELAGIDNYDETFTDTTTPKVTISLADIQTQTGIDFTNGMVGYGNFSQQGATIIGINLESYNTYIDDEYIDSFDDNMQPKVPTITGKCTYSSYIEEEYEFTIDYSDTYEKVEYKLQVFDEIDWTIHDSSDAESIYTTPLYETDPIYITKFSDIDKMHWNTGIYSGDIVSTNICTVITDEAINDHKRHVLIKRQLLTMDNTLYFCDNTRKDAHDELQAFLKDFNAQLCIVDSQNEEYLKSIMLLQESEEPFYHIGNTPVGEEAVYFNGDVFVMDNFEWNYYGEFKYGTVSDFLPYATIRYQIILVPGKGEDDA